MSAKQCEWYDEKHGLWHSGIIVEDMLICGCCGTIYKVSDVEKIIYQENWEDLDKWLIE